jgi:hypothetical protein
MDEVKREERVARLRRSCKATSFEHLEDDHENTNGKRIDNGDLEIKIEKIRC